MITSLKPNEYWPTSPRSGNNSRKIFRMQNMIVRGEGQEVYAEVYGGSLDLNEDIPTSAITGTVATDTTSTLITGTGTSFLDELHPGQFVLATKALTDVTIPIVVDEVIDDTHFSAHRIPHDGESGLTLNRLPVMFELNKKRGTLLRGNAVEVDLGSILAVGEGTLRRNGSVLPGTSLVATRSPKIALFNSTTGNFTVASLGLATPATLSAAAIAGGTKNMQAGVYSVRAVEARQATRGYGNPSPKAEVTIAAGDKIRATLPATTADAWMFFVTLFLPGQGIQGPWFRYELPTIYVPVGSGVGEIPAAGGTWDIEYNDAEVSGNDLLTFNNDPPPDASFVLWMGGMPVYLSCQGPGNTSPGPFIATGKPRNIEAVPPTQYVSTSPPDTIIGGLVGVQGRLYLMCANSLQIAVATQATDPRIPAFAVRPFWRSGFPNPETLLTVGDNLVGMTTNGLARSISDGDQGSEEYNFAVAITELLQGVSPGHSLLKLDPKNNAVALFLSAYSLNGNGFWTTRVLLYGLRQNAWIGDMLLSSLTGDMVVCSAATVSGNLEFLAGGLQDDGSVVIRTYRWDDMLAGEDITYYMAWQYGDDGVEDRPKVVTSLRPTGRFNAVAELSVHGALPGVGIDPFVFDDFGQGPSLSDTFQVTQYDRIECDYDNLMQWTVAVKGVCPAGVDRDRVDEIVVETYVRGPRQ